MSNKSTTIHLDEKRIDLFKYIDENSNFLKKQYIEIVFNISKLKINNLELRNILNHNGHSLWEMSLINEKNIYKTNSVFKTIKYLALKKILIENINKDIRISFLEKDLQNILKKEFIDKKLIFNNSNYSFREKFRNILFQNLLLNYIYFLYFFLKNCNFSKKIKIDFSKKKFFIFSYFTHYDSKKFVNKIFYPKQWAHLWKMIYNDTNFVQLFIPNKKFKFFFQIKNFLKDKKFENLKSKNFINEYITFKYLNRVRKDLKNFKTRVNYYKIENLFKNNKEYEFFYKINKELFVSSFSGYTFLQNLLWINVFDDILSTSPQHSFGIFLYENQPWEKALITSWKKFNHGQLIGYSHTTINFWHLNYFNCPNYNISDHFEKFNPDIIAVSSEISKNFLIEQSINPKKITEVEALRYTWILDKINRNKEKKKRILFLGDYKNTINEKLINILNESKFDLNKSGFDITFKPHPANIAKNIDKNIREINEDL